MSDLIKVTATMRLVKEPELKETKTGSKFLVFNAVSNVYDANAGERKQRPIWWNCAYFGGNAESVFKAIKKGSLVCASADMDQVIFNERLSNKLKIDNLNILPSRVEVPAPAENNDLFDDIPF